MFSALRGQYRARFGEGETAKDANEEREGAAKKCHSPPPSRLEGFFVTRASSPCIKLESWE